MLPPNTPHVIPHMPVPRKAQIDIGRHYAGLRDFPIYSKRRREIYCADTDTSRRIIEPFQIGETPTFISHIKAGLDVLASDNARLLVFSGGDTKRSKTSL